jgi:type I restriction enzyme R subunit
VLPEQLARKKIDTMLAEAGWEVVDRADYSSSVSAVAVREGLLKNNQEADYLLFIDNKVIGVLEAKSEATALSEKVEVQAENYTHRLLDWYLFWQKPLPFVYLSNGRQLLFRDTRNKNSKYERLKKMHSPKNVVRLAGIGDDFSGLPFFPYKSNELRKCQFEAITALENSFRKGQRRALMVLATGSGKTFTACMAAYRLLSYTPTKRILFLVDRNNLGRQAESEFGSFRLTETRDVFSSIFAVERLKSRNVPTDSAVVISTIQRLFALLTNQEIADNDDEDSEFDCVEDTPPVELTDNVTLAADFFDLIIVDECHRSIYNRWQKVLTYFSNAKIVGLTATPSLETDAFFNNNRIINYTLEKSIADKINVSPRVFRIKTKVSTEGGEIKKGQPIIQIARYTGDKKNIIEKLDTRYDAEAVNRSIINEGQIRLILEEYKKSIYTSLYPEREPHLIEYTPKTLIFAQNDRHADNIVRIAKEVFSNQSDDFIQKITYTSHDSNQLIRDFRTSKTFRIAVTVTLVATGIDIKPLEVVMFMRDVCLETTYLQMKGRGVRIIGDVELRNVTPNAVSKDYFFLVDAVGVTENEKLHFISSAGEKFLSLEDLLEQITHGYLPDEHLQLLGSKLARIDLKSTEKQREKFKSIAGVSMHALSTFILSVLTDDSFPKFIENGSNTERKNLVLPLSSKPEARNNLIILNAGFIKVLRPGEDSNVYTGFSVEDAKSTTQAFEKYVNEHKDELEALRIIYNNSGEPIKYAMLNDLKEKLLLLSGCYEPSYIWNSYAAVNMGKVSKLGSKKEKEALTNLIQLVRYAFKIIPELKPLYSLSEQRFELWCSQIKQPLTSKQKELLRQLIDHIVSNGSYTIEDLKLQDSVNFAQFVQNFGRQGTDETLSFLSQFILKA